MNLTDDKCLLPANSKRTVRLPPAARQDLLGKSYANLLRCSNLTQADAAPDGQKLINDGFSSANGMNWVTDIFAEGVSGSQTFNRQDLQDVLDAHRKTPFDVLVIHDLSRLTRGGPRHGSVVEDMFRKAGIKVVSSTDFIPDTPEGEVVKAVKHYANQLQARSISLAVARGLSQSLAKNNRPAAGRNPYGLDREYLGPDGTPRLVVRWEGRTQLWLNPTTLDPIGERVRPPKLSKDELKRLKRKKDRIFKGYTKQADETSRLVRGSDARHDVLVWMFTAYDVWKWGYHRIAQHLNQVMRIPSPDGDQWVLRSVKGVLFNPIYLGIEVRHRWTGSLYNMVTETGTMAVQVDQDQLEREGRTSVPQTERPRGDWRLVDVPHLKDVLPNPMREIAAERIMRQFDTTIPPHPRKGKALHTGEGRHKQLNSPFLLTHILRSKQTDHPMRGELINKKLVGGRKTQYRYYFDGGAALRGEKGLHIRRMPADSLEQAVVGVIRQVLNDADEVQERVRSSVAALLSEQPDERPKRDVLLAEQEDLSGRLRQAYKLLGKRGVEVLEAEIAKDTARLEAVTKELKTLDRSYRSEQINAEEVTKGIAQRVQETLKGLAKMPNAEMKQLLAAMVDGLRVDLETGELDFAVVLTDWMQPPQMASESDTKVRLDCPLPWPSSAEANANLPKLLLSRWSCQLAQKRCYQCSRRAA